MTSIDLVERPIQADAAFRCPECRAWLVRTGGGYWCCPSHLSHTKLIEDLLIWDRLFRGRSRKETAKIYREQLARSQTEFTL